ncbi:hypothetical protein BLA60_37870 [Actinophytocola xinjiangensis]|uniref:Uncharacterized protein n=1 Tax=Actinophytocola xinjiangensis TaxID=485602 RepID=A0A7Z0WEU9_9PSEU|nr:DUF6350 family protein [Actinophytocola xinjiangensis]OLF05008.1 hypothetical protein BLA60_37870 [Actinophytocola xinjiangensis]
MAPPQPAPTSQLTRAKAFVLAAAVPPVAGYAVVAAVLALVTGIAPHATFSVSGVLAAALPAWLAAHQVPVTIAGAEFGALPLLATLLVMLLAGRCAARALTRLDSCSPVDAGVLVGSIAAAHGVCGLVAALAQTGPVVTVDPLAALYYPALIAAVAATVGVLRRGGLAGDLAERVDDVARHGLVAGAFSVGSLLAAGAAVLTFGFATSASTMRELFAGFAPGVGAGLGMLLLCLGYLPNAVVAGTAFVAGPGFAIGDLDVSPMVFTDGGRVPGLPLLAALPEQQAGWWPVLCLVPVGVGILVGRRLRGVAERPLTRLRAVAVAVGVLAVVTVVAAGSAGGRLGGGAFDPLTLHAPAVSLILVVAVGAPAAAVAWFGVPAPGEPEETTEAWDYWSDTWYDDGHDDGPAAEPDDQTDAEPDDRAGTGPDDRTDDKADDRAGDRADDRTGDRAGDRAGETESAGPEPEEDTEETERTEPTEPAEAGGR